MKEIDKKIIKDVLAAFVFLCASYISARFYKDDILFFIFGIAFLLAGLFGVICISKRISFIFGQ